MLVRTFAIAAILAASPALAEEATPKAANNAENWSVFQKLYPKRALEAHEEGAVGFTVTLDSRGDVMDCQVTHSSGHPLLDQETCKLVTLNAKFGPETAVGPSQTKTHEGLIVWKLPQSTAVLGAPTQIAASSAPEKVICKKSVATGSLARVDRVCMTLREWDRQSDDAKEMWADIQGKKGSTHGN